MLNEKRTFKLLKIDSYLTENDIPLDLFENTFKGKRPNQVALKIFNKLCCKLLINNCTINFTINETTDGSKYKKYYYKGMREKLLEPKVIMIKGEKVVINYKNTVHKLN
jgi:hypothetical protein